MNRPSTAVDFSSSRHHPDGKALRVYPRRRHTARPQDIPPPPLLPLLLNTMTTTITLLSLQCVINSSLYQELQLSALVRHYHGEETTTFVHKISLRVTRSGGSKVLKFSPSSPCTIHFPLLIGNTSTKAEQCLLSRLTTVAGANCGECRWTPSDWPSSIDWPWCSGSSRGRLVHRPSEGAFVCWICGETRPERRLPRALDHVRGHFNHRPYHCSETHFDPHIGRGSARLVSHSVPVSCSQNLIRNYVSF